MDSHLWDQFRSALDAENKEEALERIVLALKAEGTPQKQVYDLFREVFIHYRDNGIEEQYDALANTLDRIVGWGCKSNWLFDNFSKT